MNFDDYKLMAYDKLQKDIKEVCEINMIRGTCLLCIKRNKVRTTVERFFEDVAFLYPTGQKDIHGKEILEGHIIESVLTVGKMLVKYGEYNAYCPTDKQSMRNVGFYVSMEGYQDMPLGPTEEYAEIIGHINTNHKLMGIKDGRS